MGYVQRSTADEDSGGAVLFLLKAPLLHHQAERSIQTERRGERRETMARAMWTKGYCGTMCLHNICIVHPVMLMAAVVMGSVTTTNMD